MEELLPLCEFKEKQKCFSYFSLFSSFKINLDLIMVEGGPGDTMLCCLGIISLRHGLQWQRGLRWGGQRVIKGTPDKQPQQPSHEGHWGPVLEPSPDNKSNLNLYYDAIWWYINIHLDKRWQMRWVDVKPQTLTFHRYRCTRCGASLLHCSSSDWTGCKDRQSIQ